MSGGLRRSTQTVKTSSLHKPAPAEEAGVLSNGNWDYWDRRRQADVEEVPGRASEKQMSRL